MGWFALLGLVFAASGGLTTAAARPQIDGAASASAPAVRLTPDPTTGRPGRDDAPPPPSTTRPVDTSRPDIVIGSGSPAGCTSAAVVDAVERGGVITFDCGPEPVTIAMTATAKVVNTSQVVVIDGGGLVTLDGLGQRRILYMNTCDRAQVWTTPTCQNQDHPRLTIQGLTFTRGDATGETTEGGGGGAVFVRGGRVQVVDSTFHANRCDATGPDVGGAALRVLSQFDGLPVVVARSWFTDNQCSNGGATSSIGVSWQIYNSTFVDNRAIGNGANPQRAGTPGGGNGGAIYLDGNEMTLELVGSVVRDNVANEGGGAVFFVSNNRTGRTFIRFSDLIGNPSRGFETRGFPGIFHLGSGPPAVTDSVLR
ncbi:MAG: hypothetical protein WA964_11870 [Ilumatobacter sp.]|uniref:hypothetical protein n=1 Tax=Ilumatobacter sp. TaxID=1967498 RepID=UPI003C77043E